MLDRKPKSHKLSWIEAERKVAVLHAKYNAPVPSQRPNPAQLSSPFTPPLPNRTDQGLALP